MCSVHSVHRMPSPCVHQSISSTAVAPVSMPHLSPTMACRERLAKKRRTGGADRPRSSDTGGPKYHAKFRAWHPDTPAAPDGAMEAACAAAEELVEKLSTRKIYAQAKVPDSSFTQSYVHNLYRPGSCSLARPVGSASVPCEEQVLRWLINTPSNQVRMMRTGALQLCLLITVQPLCCRC